jgi:NAD(P)-dependent dehydrogenase (short-subunit alcohol dehydrogenase family)
MSLFDLNDKVVLLTGATGYLGQTLAWGIARAGAKVVIHGRSQDKVDQLRQQMQSEGLSVQGLTFDLNNHNQVKIQIEKVMEKNKTLDVLINNAYQGSAKSLENSTVEDFDNSLSSAVSANHYLIQQLLPFLKNAGKEDGASIINIASMYALVSPKPQIYGNSGMNNPPYYGAAKAALIQFTRYLACHLAPENIRVNSISPGAFPPDRVTDNHPQFHQALNEQVPLNRVGRPDELIGPVAFMASNASSYVTGTNLVVDGGWTAW